ncbi:MAG TPA: TIGR00730 family Rossman fold protein [Verrucomicrobiae bacterium]|jgi:uncharacterized protein (TIGR00730 family)|nr:TIGR00730 family Rossman fold protein [Verrucomicrobiae bacterium]
MELEGKKLLVFCASSSQVPQVYHDAASELGLRIAVEGAALVFGGTDMGLMGRVARAAREGGGKVYAAIPQMLHDKKLCFTDCEEVYVSEDLRTRKAKMELWADAIICFPGGIGTLDELAETLAHKQLGAHQKPLVLFNFRDYFRPFLDFVEKMIAEGFAKPKYRDLFYVASTLDEAFLYLKSEAVTA